VEIAFCRLRYDRRDDASQTYSQTVNANAHVMGHRCEARLDLSSATAAIAASLSISIGAVGRPRLWFNGFSDSTLPGRPMFEAPFRGFFFRFTNKVDVFSIYSHGSSAD
jgi:hypothetical protein